MKKLIVLCCVIFAAGTNWAQRSKVPTQESVTRRAFDIREKLDPTMGGVLTHDEAFLNAINAITGKEASNVRRLREQRWHAWLARIPRLVETKNIVNVKLAKGDGTNQWIITLIDVDGRQTTLWCANDSGGGNIPVREITPH